MDRRLVLHEVLKSLGAAGTYFQPPPNVQMVFPAIVYERDDEDVKRANNGVYSRTKRYKVTVIDRNPDSLLPDKVADLPLSSFSSHFVAENLNHDVYSVYF